ncbi:MAG: thymidylate synthase [Micrococcales bacterium]|nr:thymidylate synthase [Micrococcales bacterium]
MDTAIINIPDGVNGYVDLVQHVLKYGKEAAPRGMKTREIEDAIIRIDDIHHTLPLGVGRGTVPGIGSVEACQLLAGVATPKLVIEVGPMFKNYAEDNGVFHGAYGARTQDQYAPVIERLKKDPDSRQAVVTIWNPELDLLPEKRDYPCTILHQFRIRDNKLNMSVYMRSNDVWLGAAYDFFQFTRVQIAMASVLGVAPGSYAHHVGSLHIYEQHYGSAENLKHTTEPYENIPAITGANWQQVKDRAMGALTAAMHREQPMLLHSLHPFEGWYANAMIKAIKSR